jgi:Putative auto-transporter adhesin, head GIN domain
MQLNYINKFFMKNILLVLPILFLFSYYSFSREIYIRTAIPGFSPATAAIPFINPVPEPVSKLLLPDPVIKKELKVEKAFKGIRIEGDISLVLTNAPAGTVIVEGKQNQIGKLNPIFETTTLVIDASQKNFFSKFTIYLSALALEAIQFNGDGNISSAEFIQSNHLYITLGGAIDIRIKTLGQISFDTREDIELVKPRVCIKKN